MSRSQDLGWTNMNTDTIYEYYCNYLFLFISTIIIKFSKATAITNQ